MKKNLFSIVACTLLFISCKKNVDEPAQVIHINFSKEALAYVQMPANKYYIYKDSATGETDSVVVTKSTLETQLMPSQTYNILGLVGLWPAYNYQTFTLVLSKIIGSTSTDWFSGIANAGYSYFIGANTDAAGVWLIERNRSATVFDSPSFLIDHSKIISPTITLEGKDYSAVVQFTNSIGQPSNQNYLAYTYYWAKGIGIIKRSITTGNTTQTWTLVRNG